jgi:purine-binding chemotaxis protein CheW
MEEENKKNSIAQLVVFSLDGEEYAVPVQDVQTIINMPEITPVPNGFDFVAGLINLRGRVISIIDLEKRFSLHRDDESIKSQHIMVVDSPDAPFGVIVDEVIEVLRVSNEMIQATPETVNAKIGTEYIKGVIVIDENKIIENAELQDISSENELGMKNTSKEKQRIILILDLKEVFIEEKSD